MSIENQLAVLKNKIDKEVKLFFDCKIEQIKDQERPEELLEMTENLKDFILRSGKRIRPILFYCGYLIAGGKEKEEILKATISIELIHAFFLIHDDIIDQDDVRHNGLAMHCAYSKKYKDKVKYPKHFGISAAIVVGDLAHDFGYEILTKSNFSSELKIKAFKKMNQIVSNTLAGETIDVALSMKFDFNERKIMEMQEYKTAKYTIEGPLHLGAVLAGADEEFLKSLSKFAIPLGVAFQIQDDIIGIFGDEQKVGKPIGSDIKEGKKTLLITRALKVANEEQKNIILSSLGNKEINLEDIKNARKVIEETGSLQYSKTQAEKLKELSKKHLAEIKTSDECKDFLNNLADFIVKRDR